MSATDSTARAALEFIKLGWFVFPVQGSSAKGDDAKRPIKGLRWSQESTIDDQQVAFWFSGTNYGVAVDMSRSNLMVIDVDHPELFDVDESLLVGAWRYHGNPERRAYLFRMPPGRMVPSARHAWGEVKAAGGYVVLPPSFHPVGGEYVFDEQPGDLPGVAPLELVDLVRPVHRKVQMGIPKDSDREADQAEIDYCTRKMQRMAAALAALHVGSRNVELNSFAWVMGKSVPHILDEAEVRRLARDACERNGLIRDDGIKAFEDTLNSGLRAGMSTPEWPIQGVPVLDIDMSDLVFDADPVLQELRQAAWSMGRCPWGVLGSSLARVVAEMPPRLVLPGLTGAETALNLYVALVGPPSTGKSQTHRLAGRWLYDNIYLAEDASAGSGEGILDTFLNPPDSKKDKDKDKDDEPPVDAALAKWEAEHARLKIYPNTLMYIDEIASLYAQKDRKGSTIDSFLRSMYMGESVGTTASHAGGRSRHLPALSYRLCIVAGVQPNLAQDLLSAVDAGTPQRWLWMPSTDPMIPHWRNQPDYPGPINWKPPTLPGHAHDLVVVELPERVIEEVREDNYRRATGGVVNDPLEGHAMLTRIKVAVAVALLLTKGWKVEWKHWIIAGHIMEVSRRTRDSARDSIATAQREEQGKRKAARVAQEIAVVDGLAARKIRMAAEAMGRVVAGPRDHSPKHRGKDDQRCTRNCLNRAANRNHAGHADEALAYAIREGWIVERSDGGGQQPTRYVPGAKSPWKP